jgi:DNA-binding transcriptional MerR regulator
MQLRIGELGAATDTKVETIRYYERVGLLPRASRTAGNYRAYDSGHLQQLMFIRRARELGFEVHQIRELLTLSDTKQCSGTAFAEIVEQNLIVVNRKVRELHALARELDRLLSECQRGANPKFGFAEALSDVSATDRA